MAFPPTSSHDAPAPAEGSAAGAAAAPARPPKRHCAVSQSAVKRELRALQQMFGVAPVEAPRPQQVLSESEFEQQYSKKALLLLSTQTEAYTEALRARLRELCSLVYREESELKLRLLDSLAMVLEWFAAPHRELEVAAEAAQHQASWLTGDAEFLSELRQGVGQIVAHRRVREDVRRRCVRVALLAVEVFGQSWLVGTVDEGSQTLHALVRSCQVEVEVVASDAARMGDERGGVKDEVVAAACASARLLEYVTAFLVDEEGEWPAAAAAARLTALPAADLVALFSSLGQVYLGLLNFFQDVHGEVRCPVDVALHPLACALLSDFDESLHQLEAKRVRALFEVRGVPL